MRQNWRARYSRELLILDGAILLISMALATMLKFGVDDQTTTVGIVALNYVELGLTIAATWMVCLTVAGARDPRILGDGAKEYKRVLTVTAVVFGIVASLSVLLKTDISRGYLAVAYPVGLVGLLVGRKLMRVRQRHRWEKGLDITPVLIIGGVSGGVSLARLFGRHATGMTVGGVYVPDLGRKTFTSVPASDCHIPIFDRNSTLREVLSATKATMVIVSDSDHLGHQGLNELVWALGDEGIDLMVSPNVIDVAASRLELAQVASIPFLHIDEPRYESAAAWPKLIFDKVTALALLALFSPVLIAAAAGVKMTSPGDIFYRQERIGKDGTPFKMTKFRSMYQGSHAKFMKLLEERGSKATAFVKIGDDPRVTPFGKFMRRYSIDELPQLFDVVRGNMSLVGPRPQQQYEVDTYDQMAHRRLRVRPGMTGLWQVSGRSDLTREEALRLDSYYVENWSLMGDIIILWRTIRAVIKGSGAY